MKDKILKTINTPWFPGIFIILALIIFTKFAFFNKKQLLKSMEEQTSAKGSLTVKVAGLRNNKGNVIVLLFTAAPLTRGNVTDVRITNVADGNPTVVFSDIPLRDYAILVFHDENSNNNPDVDADNKLLEGFGLSNIKEPRQTIGEFDEAKFHFDQNTSEIQVAIFYF